MEERKDDRVVPFKRKGPIKRWWNKQSDVIKVAYIGLFGVIFAAVIGIIPSLNLDDAPVKTDEIAKENAKKTMDTPQKHEHITESFKEKLEVSIAPKLLHVSCKNRNYLTLTPTQIEASIEGHNAAQTERRFETEYRGQWYRIKGPAIANTDYYVDYEFPKLDSSSMQFMISVRLVSEEDRKQLLQHTDGDSITTEGRLRYRGSSGRMYLASEGRIVKTNEDESKCLDSDGEQVVSSP